MLMSSYAPGSFPWRVLRKDLMKVSKLFDENETGVTFSGNIASLVVQTKWMQTFNVNNQSTAEYANTKGWVVSIATAGAVFGCLGVRLIPSRKSPPSFPAEYLMQNDLSSDLVLVVHVFQ